MAQANNSNEHQSKCAPRGQLHDRPEPALLQRLLREIKRRGNQRDASWPKNQGSVQMRASGLPRLISVPSADFCR